MASSMDTPFGVFLDLEMPALTDVYVDFPVGHDVYELDRSAARELERLLCHGRIQRLHYMCTGESDAEVLQWTHLSAREMMDELIGEPGIYTAGHEFERRYPVPELNFVDDALEEVEATNFRGREEWINRRTAHKWKHAEMFEWKWGDRDTRFRRRRFRRWSRCGGGRVGEHCGLRA